MTVKRVILIRSGETDWNRDDRWQGWVAIPLNEHGRKQARALANFIRNIGISALYSSDLRRAAETATLLAGQLGYDPIYDGRLRERNIGQWQGMSIDEIRAWYPEDYERLRADVRGFKVPGGESRKELQQRVVAAFNDILQQDKGETIAIVTHTTATRVLLDEIIPNHDIAANILGNTAVTTIVRESEAGDWQLVAPNDTLHLEGLESKNFPDLEERS
jgi:broad specificity phosphatase PhoE